MSAVRARHRPPFFQPRGQAPGDFLRRNRGRRQAANRAREEPHAPALMAFPDRGIRFRADRPACARHTGLDGAMSGMRRPSPPCPPQRGPRGIKPPGPAERTFADGRQGLRDEKAQESESRARARRDRGRRHALGTPPAPTGAHRRRTGRSIARLTVIRGPCPCGRTCRRAQAAGPYPGREARRYPVRGRRGTPEPDQPYPR